MAFTQGHALVIGVGSLMNHPNANVPIASIDAQAISSVLQDAQRCGYPAAQITLLRDEHATRQAVLAALDTLGEQLTENDTLFLFFVGHGVYGTDGNYYLTTHDVRLKRSQVMAGTGVSELELLERLRKVNAKRIFIMINACHSGALHQENFDIDENAETIDSEAPPQNLTDAMLSTGEGRIIITACRPDQKSWIGSGDLSIFTEAVVSGLRGAAPNNHGYVSAYGLYEHVYFESKDSAKTLGFDQDAVLTVLQGVGPFPVALYRGAQEPGSFDVDEPKPEETALREVSASTSQRHYKRYQAHLEGDGAIAQGDGAVAVGRGGIHIGGNVTSSTVITGNNNIVGKGNPDSGLPGDTSIDAPPSKKD